MQESKHVELFLYIMLFWDTDHSDNSFTHIHKRDVFCLLCL